MSTITWRVDAIMKFPLGWDLHFVAFLRAEVHLLQLRLGSFAA